LVYLVSLGYPVSLAQPNKRDKPNKPDKPDEPDKFKTKRTAFLSVLRECTPVVPNVLAIEGQ